MHKFIRFDFRYQVRESPEVMQGLFSKSRKLLKQIKFGRYANVGVYDSEGQIYLMQLRYNRLRRKFYLCIDSTKLFRYNITKKTAIKILSLTLYSKDSYYRIL